MTRYCVCVCDKSKQQELLFPKVAIFKIVIIIHYIFRPVRLVLRDCQIQPWFVVSIVMDDSPIVYLS